jgi:GNAT superfamily N-acetyltransferase
LPPSLKLPFALMWQRGLTMTPVMTHTADYMTSVMMLQAPSPPPAGVADVTLLRPASSDIEAVLAMLHRCSRAALFHRFHGFTDGRAYFEQQLRDRPLDETLLAWRDFACVGVATLGVGADGRTDLGLLVEDSCQRQGIGGRLAASLLEQVRANGVTAVHADVLGDDEFILRALRQISPLKVKIESGIFSIDIDLHHQNRWARS